MVGEGGGGVGERLVRSALGGTAIRRTVVLVVVMCGRALCAARRSEERDRVSGVRESRVGCEWERGRL